MANRPEDEIHGEPQPNAPFPGSHKQDETSGGAGGVYDGERSGAGGNKATDQTSPSASIGKPDNRAGNPNDPRGELSRPALKTSEGSGATGGMTPAEAFEKSLLADKQSSLYRRGDTDSGGRFSKLRARARNASKRQVATLAIVGVLGGGGVFGGAVLQGPLQFVHLAQKLQKFHLSSNENFGDDRMMNILLYAKGSGERSRLGLTANKAADAWEKQLIKQTGMKPIYQSGTRRFVGFEIVDDAKAQRYLGSSLESGSRSNQRVQASLGSGAEITDPDKVNGGRAINSSGENATGKVINLSNVSFADRKAWIKTVGQATGTNKLTSSLASRLLIKRGGVNFHPLNKVKGKFDDAAAKRIQERREKNISDGVQAGDGPRAGTQRDEAGNDVADSADESASQETKSAIDSVKNGTLTKAITGPAVIVGVLCMAKSYGKSVEEFQYTNNVLPMLRMGMDTIATGNQVMSGNDLDMATLGQLTQYMYDQEQRTSWTQAESIRAEEGKSGGTKMPETAVLGSASDKPEIFKKIDSIPVLGTVCGVAEGIFGAIMDLPVIKQVSQVATDAATKGIDTALGVVDKDLSVEKLANDALQAVAGKGVDPSAKGADYGNLTNTGAFIAGNDQAVAMGGKDLTSAERLEVAMLQKDYEKQENASKTMIARYFNPLDSESAVSSLIDAAPASPTHAANMISNPLKMFSSSFSNALSLFSPKASAAAYTYDYGMPKVGFSVDEMKSDLFEDPYANGQRVNNDGKTLEDDLPRLNDKYGNKCFGMTVTAGPDGVRITTQDKSELKQVYKNRKSDPICKDTTDRLNQYRMYIADAVTAISLSCNEGDETACSDLGIINNASADSDAPVAGAGAAKIVGVAEKEFEKNGNKPLEVCGENCGPEVQKYTGGPAGPDAPWCAWFVSWVYRESGYEFSGAPAGADGNIPAVVNLVAWFKQYGEHIPQNSSKKPEPGDVVMYGGSVHTGIVVKVDGDNIETIEGNTSGDGSFNANGETVGRKSFNYKTYTSRSIEFGRLKNF